MDYIEEEYSMERTVLRRAGIMPENYTDHQLEVMTQPWAAPENYHQDGEITPSDAEAIWTRKLAALGVDEKTIKKLKNLFL